MNESLGEILAGVNALLNGSAAVFMVAAWRAIRRGDRRLHRRRMLAATGLSALFLCCYLARVALTGTHRYPGAGAVKAFYYVVLISHMVLAAVTPPLVLAALYLALKERFDRHRAVVRWTFPIWLYVSVTGVLVYLMLYRLPTG